MTDLLEQPPAVAAGPRPAVHASWRRLAVRCVLAPVVVLAPLTALAPAGDQRYNVYWHGSAVRNNPWMLFTENVRTVPMYLDFGNFRPLGRMLEWALDVLAYLLVEIVRLPAGLALRLLSVLAAVALTGAVVLLAEAVTARGRMFAAPPSRPLALLPFAVAAGLVAAGPMSPTVRFGPISLLSAALALAVAAWLCARQPRIGPLLAAGAALAATNETAALAVPLATAAVLIRHFILRRPSRRPIPLAFLWLGFLPVFVPIRLLIHRACADGDCYPGSDLAPSDALAALPNRLTSWLPPAQWTQAAPEAMPSMVVLVLAAGVCALLIRRTMVELAELPPAGRRAAAALTTVGAAVLLSGALLGALSVGGQDVARAGWGLGWRDSPLTTAGGALLIAGLVAALASVPSASSAAAAPPARIALSSAARLPVPRFALAGLAVLLAGSAAANQAYAMRANRLPQAIVDNAIAGEVSQFEATPEGDARRCALRDRFAALVPVIEYDRFDAGELPGTSSPTERLDLTLDMATVQMYGEPFCRRNP